ncbi:hypothetical protein [Cyanobium sp. N5-Cardenillas]|uniref:hypothetical protein n=1 Tax=Cyanobium sp. N5-Cardenillas TaxID=2823720 RepID=UPI0020CBE453|nr:hypothetical protein [Cyanobium sp. N5-Cardenillas]MCP9786776.1 hypothetical protein [Cyanobium sp. N5-Cardenillas]
MAFSVLTPSGITIDIKAMLDRGMQVNEVNRQLRGSRGICLQCLLAWHQLTQAQAEGLDRATLEASVDSTFRCGHRRRKRNPETGKLADEEIMVEPHYFHPEPLLNEAGEKIQRPCESVSKEHVAFLDWMMGSAREWCLDGIPSEEPTLILREARYRTDPPRWRSPDLAIVRCTRDPPNRVMAEILRHGFLTPEALQMVSAVELQLSRISVQEISSRTEDHCRHFADVRWVFVERHLAGMNDARCWLAENGHEAFVIRQESDKSRILGIETLPPPVLMGEVSTPTILLPCTRSLMVGWLAKGYAQPEALTRAKGERDAIHRTAEEDAARREQEDRQGQAEIERRIREEQERQADEERRLRLKRERQELKERDRIDQLSQERNRRLREERARQELEEQDRMDRPLVSGDEVETLLNGVNWVPGWVVLAIEDGEVVVGHADGRPGRLFKPPGEVRRFTC